MVVKTNENGFFLSLLYFIPLGIIQLERSHGVYRLCPPSKRIASFSLPFPLVLFSFLRSMLLDNKFYSHYTNSNNSNTNDPTIFFFFFLANFLQTFQFKIKNITVDWEKHCFDDYLQHEFEFLFFYE